MALIGQRLEQSEKEHKEFREEVRALFGGVTHRLDVKINGRLDEQARILTAQATNAATFKAEMIGEIGRIDEAVEIVKRVIVPPTPPQLLSGPIFGAKETDGDSKPLTRRDLVVFVGAIIAIQMLAGFVFFVSKIGPMLDSLTK